MNFSSCHYEELTFFQKHNEDVLQGFVEKAFEYLTSERTKHKSYTSAATQLNSDPSMIKRLIEVLADLLLEIVKAKLDKLGFTNHLTSILKDIDKINLIWDFVTLKHDVISQLLYNTKINSNQFSALNWRLQHQIASKPVKTCQDTHFIIEMEVKSLNGKLKRYMSADIPNLLHVTEVLESALNEVKSTHVRKLMNARS